MAKQKILWTLIALLSVATAASGIADTVADDYAQAALKRALVTFAAARTLNGVISVVQSTEVGVGVTVSVGEILDPINDLVERFSAVMLVAASSLGLQNVLLKMTSATGITVALAIAAAVAILALWWPQAAERKYAATASRILLVLLCIRFVVPALVVATNLVTDTFLAAEQVEATAALEGTSRKIEELHEGVEEPVATDQSLMDRLSSALDESLETINISQRLRELKENAASATEHIVQLIVLFVLQTILLPLAFIWVLVELLKGTAARLTAK
ncbi:MAG: hypothetical protein OEO82_13020 [Gammaproteobacteria bacterium]|nr:hypothetical protein [Gammaproteobacteria bacterium]